MGKLGLNVGLSRLGRPAPVVLCILCVVLCPPSFGAVSVLREISVVLVPDLLAIGGPVRIASKVAAIHAAVALDDALANMPVLLTGDASEISAKAQFNSALSRNDLYQ